MGIYWERSPFTQLYNIKIYQNCTCLRGNVNNFIYEWIQSHYTAEIFRTAISVWSKRQLWVACEPSSLDFFFFLSSPSCSAGCKMLRANFSWKTTSQRNTSLWVHQGTKAEKLCMLSWSWQASGAEPAHESPKEWMQSRVSIEWIQNLPRWIEWINSK